MQPHQLEDDHEVLLHMPFQSSYVEQYHGRNEAGLPWQQTNCVSSLEMPVEIELLLDVNIYNLQKS